METRRGGAGGGRARPGRAEAVRRGRPVGISPKGRPRIAMLTPPVSCSPACWRARAGATGPNGLRHARAGAEAVAGGGAGQQLAAGKGGAVPLILEDFVGSVVRFAWANDNGSPWGVDTCASVARGGHLEVLVWARAHGCPWDSMTCARAAGRGHLEVLQWAREHHCPWNSATCHLAAKHGHLDVLQSAVGAGAPLPVG